LGIQSFNPEHLQALGRVHDREQAIQAAELALKTFARVNLDVMYALPQQTLQQALQDAQLACDLKPEHLSFYHLTLEPNTAFHRNPPSLPDDDLSASMQEEIEALLKQHGYQHYETSAFAQPGKLCRHNINYWTFGDYLGIGAGAHSKLSFHDRIIRQTRHKHPNRYLSHALEGNAVDAEWGIEDLSFEFMMNGLRLVDGFDLNLYEQRTGLPITRVWDKLNIAKQKGLIDLTVSAEQRMVKPTLLGQRFLNELLQIFL
jgi:oxygen-independent coproporphyrinogen-3 oxidase